MKEGFWHENNSESNFKKVQAGLEDYSDIQGEEQEAVWSPNVDEFLRRIPYLESAGDNGEDPDAVWHGVEKMSAKDREYLAMQLVKNFPDQLVEHIELFRDLDCDRFIYSMFNDHIVAKTLLSNPFLWVSYVSAPLNLLSDFYMKNKNDNEGFLELILTNLDKYPSEVQLGFVKQFHQDYRLATGAKIDLFGDGSEAHTELILFCMHNLFPLIERIDPGTDKSIVFFKDLAVELAKRHDTDAITFYIRNNVLVTLPPEVSEAYLLQGSPSEFLSIAYAFSEISPKLKEKFNFDIEKVAPWWREIGDRAKTTGKYARQHAQATMTLEAKKPGIVSELSEDFQITDFARYPSDILITQNEQTNQKGKYGLFIYPKADHNGAFEYHGPALSDFFARMSDKYLFRIAEAGDRASLARLLVRMKDKYGPASFIILAGHGNPRSLQLGNYNYPDVTLRDIEGLRGDSERNSRYLDPNGAILLVSCDTGQENGVAQKLSEKLTLAVSGPDICANIKNIDLFEDSEGKLSFEETIYQSSDTGPTYFAGKKKD